MIDLLKAIFGYCPRHGWFHRCRYFRMNCSYNEESSNWMCGCKKCEKEADYYWEDMCELIK